MPPRQPVNVAGGGQAPRPYLPGACATLVALAVTLPGAATGESPAAAIPRFAVTPPVDSYVNSAAWLPGEERVLITDPRYQRLLLLPRRDRPPEEVRQLPGEERSLRVASHRLSGQRRHSPCRHRLGAPGTVVLGVQAVLFPHGSPQPMAARLAIGESVVFPAVPAGRYHLPWAEPPAGAGVTPPGACRKRPLAGGDPAAGGRLHLPRLPGCRLRRGGGGGVGSGKPRWRPRHPPFDRLGRGGAFFSFRLPLPGATGAGTLAG